MRTPRVLFFTTDAVDYLSDGLLHGLRKVLGAGVIDYPRADRLYADANAETRGRIRGRGFTLYGLLEDLPIDRSEIFQRIAEREFDLVVIGRIWHLYGDFLRLATEFPRVPLAVLDGEDSPAPYPYAGHWLRRPFYWLSPRPHRRARYFKRELTPETVRYMGFKVLPPAISRARTDLFTGMAFSIPEEKIVTTAPAKTRRFATHVVDPEVAARVGGARIKYAFDSEEAYYGDLKSAAFGITTKRAGWDCLRHYEIAANGCVPCFRELQDKPATCAPYGLSGANCLVYRDADELFQQIELMSDSRYAELQMGAMSWARENTTTQRAREFLRHMGWGEE